jgi:hypothetical protein
MVRVPLLFISLVLSVIVAIVPSVTADVLKYTLIINPSASSSYVYQWYDPSNWNVVDTTTNEPVPSSSVVPPNNVTDIVVINGVWPNTIQLAINQSTIIDQLR